MYGMSVGAGVSEQSVIHYNLFPELVKAACTIVGANESATPNTKITHLRALDFPPDAPVRNWP
jgi:hypothetical protein